MVDDNRNLELILLGITVGAIAAYLVMTVNNQLHLLNQNIATYNQYAMLSQYQYPQLQQSNTIPIEIQSTPILKPIPKKVYNVQYDSDGFITDLNTT